MIVVHYWHDSDYNPRTDGYTLEIINIIKDGISVEGDPPLIKEAVENCEEFEPKAETLYELHLERELHDVNPLPTPYESAFGVERIIELIQDPETGGWYKPIKKI